MEAGIGKFIFPKAPCAYHQTITFVFHPNDYKQPRILILEVLAIGAQRVDAKNDTLVNRASNGEAATKIAHILNEGSLRDLASLIVIFR